MGSESETGNEAKLRVFISYSHEDQAHFETLKKKLEAKFQILSDHNIGGGTPFTDAIKGFISYAHVFVALITSSAKSKPWVHQETGYAMAREIPIYTIVVGEAGIPDEMTAQLQAVQVEADLSDLEEKLDSNPIERLIAPKSPGAQDMIRIAEWPEQRGEWLAEYALRVQKLGSSGLVRQIAALSSFSIPDEPISTWEDEYSHFPKSDFGRHMLRRERQELEWHAREAGCRLIIGPDGLDGSDGSGVAARLEILKQFITKYKSDRQLEVVIAPNGVDQRNITLVGEWFVAESVAPRPSGYRNTVFNWHAPSAHARAKRFDEEFEDLAKRRKIPRGKDAKSQTLAEIEALIAKFPPQSN